MVSPVSPGLGLFHFLLDAARMARYFIFHLLHQVAERGREGMKRVPFPGERGPKGGEGPRQGEAVATDAEWNCSRRKEGRYQQRKSSAEITALMTNKEEQS